MHNHPASDFIHIDAKYIYTHGQVLIIDLMNNKFIILIQAINITQKRSTNNI